ncbi:MAG: hypothetical protein ABI467_16655 [Kofleriaceae bacterium]
MQLSRYSTTVGVMPKFFAVARRSPDRSTSAATSSNERVRCCMAAPSQLP